MRLANMLINPVNPPLEDRKEPFDSVRVYIVAHVLFRAVVHAAMATPEVPTDAGVGRGFIGHEPAVLVRVHADDRPQNVRGDVWDVEAADLSATLHESHDGLFLGN